MELENQYRYLIGGYYGVSLMDEYPLKEYILKDIENYIKAVVKENPIKDFDYKKEAENIKDTMSDKTKLQDALLVLHLMKGPMDLVFLIKKRLKNYSSKRENMDVILLNTNILIYRLIKLSIIVNIYLLFYLQNIHLY